MLRLRISDVTTTPEQPPEFRALEREGSNVFRDMKYRPEYATAQKKRYPRLAPLLSDLPPEQVFELVQAAALEMPRWHIASVEASRLQLEATAVAWFWLFKDDVVIQVRPESDGSSVHMRSKSRLGGDGVGLHAKRIRVFFKLLQKKMS